LLDSLDRLDWLPDTLGRLRARYGCYFVLGNHDWFLEPPAIRRQLEELGWTDLAGRCIAISIGDQRLALAGTEVPWMGEHPDLAPRDRCPFSVLLSHTPDNLPWARQQEFDLMLAGHVHGGQIRLPGVGPIYAPSRFGGRYACGTFWEPPTLLHVARGLSGRHPIRYRCQPEVTRLILYSTADNWAKATDSA
jgi:predicted MPP superfamily phosphohydrolase